MKGMTNEQVQETLIGEFRNVETLGQTTQCEVAASHRNDASGIVRQGDAVRERNGELAVSGIDRIVGELGLRIPGDDFRSVRETDSRTRHAIPRDTTGRRSDFIVATLRVLRVLRGSIAFDSISLFLLLRPS